MTQTQRLRLRRWIHEPTLSFCVSSKSPRSGMTWPKRLLKVANPLGVYLVRKSTFPCPCLSSITPCLTSRSIMRKSRRSKKHSTSTPGWKRRKSWRSIRSWAMKSTDSRSMRGLVGEDRLSLWQIAQIHQGREDSQSHCVRLRSQVKRIKKASRCTHLCKARNWSWSTHLIPSLKAYSTTRICSTPSQ